MRGRHAGRLVARLFAVAVAAVAVLALGLAAAALVTGDPPGEGSWTIAGALAAAVTGAALWPPARRRAVTAADRLVLGGRRAPAQLLRAVGPGAVREATPVELAEQVAETVVDVLVAAAAEVWLLGEDGALHRAVAVPRQPPAAVRLDPGASRVLAQGHVVGRAWAELWHPELLTGRPHGELRLAPAAHGGRLLGLVVVSRFAGAERFSPADDAALAELGERLGLVLHNRALDASLQDTLADLRRANEELRASRARLVAAADAERRRLERDLHDGAQQHLVALAVNLAVAAKAVTADPDAAPDVFAGLDAEVREAIAELRTLAHGIYPPLLAEAGLVEALRAAARRSPQPVQVRAGDLRRLPQEVEAAAYFCCREALQNAAKHAPGAAVTIGVDEGGGALHVTVDDDGPGFPTGPTVTHGHGLGNMLDRVGALGGTLTTGASPAGGARVAMAIPVP